MLTQSKQTVTTVANAVALSTAIVQQLSGDAVANTLAGSPATRAVLEQLVGSRVQANFSNLMKGAKS